MRVTMSTRLIPGVYVKVDDWACARLPIMFVAAGQRRGSTLASDCGFHQTRVWPAKLCCQSQTDIGLFLSMHALNRMRGLGNGITGELSGAYTY